MFNPEATNKSTAEQFCGKPFYFERTKLRARNFIVDTSYTVTCEVWDAEDEDWVQIEMSLVEFFKDLPVLKS